MEIDVFDYVIVAILFQTNFDEKLHSMTFLFKRISSTKCNYEIYNKKFLTIVKFFDK